MNADERDDARPLWRDGAVAAGGSLAPAIGVHRRSSAAKFFLFAGAAWQGRSALHAACRHGASASVAGACSDSTHAAGRCVLATAPGMQAPRLACGAPAKAAKMKICAKTLCNGARWRRAPAPLAVGRRGAKPGRQQPGRGKGGKSENPCKDPMQRGAVCGGCRHRWRAGVVPRSPAGSSPAAAKAAKVKIRAKTLCNGARCAAGAGTVGGLASCREARPAAARPRQRRRK